jgi:hypothetical protein
VSSAALVTEVESCLFSRLDLGSAHSEPLAPDIAARGGSFQRRPLCLYSRALRRGGLRVRLAKVVSADSMASLTGFVLPAPRCVGGILGFDIVSYGRGVDLFVCDVTPKRPRARDSELAELRDRALSIGVARVPEGSSGGRIPPFSEDAVFVRPFEGRQADIVGILESYVDCFLRISSSADSADWAVEAEISYLSELRAIKRQSRVLAKIFGASWVERYTRVFFAPELVRSTCETGEDGP